MCGIVGLFLKDKSLEPKLGELLADMLVTMTDRGPDSAGIAIYGLASGRTKMTLQSPHPERDFAGLEADLAAAGIAASVTVKSTHAVVETESDASALRDLLAAKRPDIRIMGTGDSVEIYKEVGLPKDVVARFASARHGRQPRHRPHAHGDRERRDDARRASFLDRPDQCLVHNGSLSNHNNLRRELAAKACASRRTTTPRSRPPISPGGWRRASDPRRGAGGALDDLDGFFTFVVGTEDGFGVLRDPIACKPAVMAETDQYVAFGSEYRALATLPGIETARVWEPEPATCLFLGSRKGGRL
jgi:glutamate synthase domain-containing protein 1